MTRPPQIQKHTGVPVYVKPVTVSTVAFGVFWGLTIYSLIWGTVYGLLLVLNNALDLL